MLSFSRFSLQSSASAQYRIGAVVATALIVAANVTLSTQLSAQTHASKNRDPIKPYLDTINIMGLGSQAQMNGMRTRMSRATNDADRNAAAAELERERVASADSVVRYAKQSLTKIPVATLPDSVLPGLIELQLYAKEHVAAVGTLHRLLADTAIAEGMRRDAFGNLIVTLGQWAHRDTTARQATLGLISLADSLKMYGVSLDGRSALAKGYRGTDDKQRSYLAARDALAFVSTLPAAERNKLAASMAGMVQNVSRWAVADSNRVESVAFTGRVATLYADDPTFLSYLSRDADRAILVGTRAAPIDVPYWINASANAKPLDLATGKVTLLEFTAHWCGPCRASYAPIVEMYKALGPRGFQPVFVTQLYGFFEAKSHLAPIDEVNENRAYFVDHYKITFPIAVALDPDAATKGDSARTNPTFEKYLVNGIPQLVLVDQQGTIRHIWEGWQVGREKEIREAITRLLDEPARTTAQR